MQGALRIFAGLAALFAFVPCAASANGSLVRAGTYERIVADDFADGTSVETSYLERAGARIQVLPTSPTLASTGDQVAVRGRIDDGRLIGNVQRLSPATTESLDEPQKTAVILLKAPGVSSPMSVATARERVFTGPDSTNAFYREESYGAISLTGEIDPAGDVFGPFTVEPGPMNCNTGVWHDGGMQGVEREGISLSAYAHLIFIFPSDTTCRWAGLATVNGPDVYINGNWASGVISHEVGHNLGLQHAKGYECTHGEGHPVPFGANCTSVEYGDYYDVMGNGSGSRHSNGLYLSFLHILSPENIERIQSNGTYTMKADLNPTTEPTLLEVPIGWDAEGKVTRAFYLECRETGGYFENFVDQASKGVSIRVYDNGSTYLIDTHPESEGFKNAPLEPGETFSGGGLTITVLAAGGGTAEVMIKSQSDFGNDHSPPTTPESLSAIPTADGVALSWGASSDDLFLAQYLVFRDGVVVGTTTEDSFVDRYAAPGEHAYTVVAVDGNGNQSAASAPAIAIAPDITPPTAPGPPVGSLSPDGALSMSWKSSMDDVGVVRYRVFQDGVELGASPTNSFVASGVSGEHTYRVLAEDAAGNKSYLSAGSRFPDLTPPLAPGSPSASVTAAGIVTLSWGPSYDNVGVTRYSVLRDGVKIGSSSTMQFQDAAAGPGEHTYALYAEDAAGNRSALSATVVAVVPDLRPPIVPAPPVPLASPSEAGPATGPSLSSARDAITVAWRRGRHGQWSYSIHVKEPSSITKVEIWISGHLRRVAVGPTISGRLPADAAGGRTIRVVGLDRDGKPVVVVRAYPH